MSSCPSCLTPTVSQATARDHQRPASWPQTVAVLLAFLAGLLFTQAATAQISCTLTNFVANPALPATLYVRNNYSTNDRVFVTTVTANFSCTATSGTPTVLFTAPGPASGSVAVASGLRWVSAGNATAGPIAGGINVTSNPGGICTGNIRSPAYKPWLNFSGTGTCAGTVWTSIAFIASAASPTGTILVDLPAGTLYTAGGWLQARNCGASTDCTGTLAVGNLATIAAPSAITLSTITSSCSLSSSSVTVTLPTVSLKAFSAGTGSMAARSAVPLSITCPSGLSAIGLSMGISFTPVSVATNGPLILNVMKSTGTAGNVGVALLDPSGNALSTGSALRITNSITAGTFSAGLTTAYVSTAATVTPGTVSATATIFLEYF